MDGARMEALACSLATSATRRGPCVVTFQMISMMFRGRDGELTIIARDWLSEHPEHRTASNWAEPGVRLAA